MVSSIKIHPRFKVSMLPPWWVLPLYHWWTRFFGSHGVPMFFFLWSKFFCRAKTKQPNKKMYEHMSNYQILGISRPATKIQAIICEYSRFPHSSWLFSYYHIYHLIWFPLSLAGFEPTSLALCDPWQMLDLLFIDCLLEQAFGIAYNESFHSGFQIFDLPNYMDCF